MPAMSFSFLLVFTVLLVLTPSTYAFGAGDIPDFAYLNGEICRADTHQNSFNWLIGYYLDKAFRHGDIEAILETLVKNVGGSAAGGGLLSFATSVLESATGGAKFNKMDIKRVYFVCLESSFQYPFLTLTLRRETGCAITRRYAGELLFAPCAQRDFDRPWTLQGLVS